MFVAARSTLLLNVQADRPGPALATCVVVPLLPAGSAPSLGSLTPQLEVDGRSMVMATNLLFSMETRHFRRPVANLAHHRDDIARALDLLFTGF